MMADMSGDPRVFFAAERTLLAWVRTGLTIMAFGFVVARFGLFLRLLALQTGIPDAHPARHTDISNVVGILLVLLGVGCMFVGAIQHRSYVATLDPADVPRSHSAVYPVGLAMMLAGLGLALALYLAV
jgi:putative membrane protein